MARNDGDCSTIPQLHPGTGAGGDAGTGGDADEGVDEGVDADEGADAGTGAGRHLSMAALRGVGSECQSQCCSGGGQVASPSLGEDPSAAPLCP